MNKTCKNKCSHYFNLKGDRNTHLQKGCSILLSIYGILLDHKCLSDSNGDAWRDKYGITYIIFTIEEIMNLMNLGNK